MSSLTRRQEAIYEFVVQQVQLVGIPPTLMEIAAAFGLRSAAGVSDHLKAIERKGYIRLRPGTSRGIQLRQSRAPARQRNAVRIPVMGEVPGLIERGTDYVYYDDRDLLGDAFALCARTGVRDCGLLANDLLIIDPGAPMVADDLGVGMQSGRTLLLRTCRENRSLTPVLGRLQPHSRVKVVGRVVGVVRVRGAADDGGTRR